MKPKLIPLQVPWAVSSTTPFMRLIVAEFKYRSLHFGASCITLQGEHYERTVTVTFDKAPWFRVNPSFGEGVVIQEEVYDWSEVEFHNNLYLGIDEWLSLYNTTWKTTGICPYPRAYEVKHSDWLPTLPIPVTDYQHLLFAGEEMSVDVVVKGWAWRYVRRQRVILTED